MGKGMEVVKRVSMIVLGSAISAVAFNCFVIPHKFLSGGISGISLLVQYMAGIPTGYLVLILNIPIFIIGMKAVDKDFILFSMLGTVSFSLLLIATKNLGKSIETKDMFLSCVYGGVLSGIGSGLVFRSRGSQGGIDIIAVIIKRKSGTSIATLSFAMNIVVVWIGAALSSVDRAMYTLIMMYISSVVVDLVIKGFDNKKMLLIITDQEQEVSAAIMKDLDRGVTFLYGEGAYTGAHKKVLYCVITVKQLVRVKKIVEDIDEKAFISIIDTAEVHGKGFRLPAL